MSTFGEELRRERELRGIRLREVSDATKISLRYLQALEGNDFEHLPGGVFNRGFVRAYSQFVGIDPDAMVNAYLLEEQAQHSGEKVHEGQLFRRPRKKAVERQPERSATIKRRKAPWIHFTWITLLLLAILVVGWLAIRHFGDREAGSVPPADRAAPAGDPGSEGED